MTTQMERRRIGVLTGLAAEWRLLSGKRMDGAELVLGCSGSDPVRARFEAERLVREGVGGLVSFGLAGGLDPDLAPGTLIVASRVVLPCGRNIAADEGWAQAALALAPGARHAPIAGSAGILVSAACKRRRFGETGAAVIDMESHIAAEVAEAAGLPFLALRTVADPAARTLPAVARIPLHPDGGIRLGAVLRTLARRPQDWPGVARLAGDTRAGLTALGALARPALLALP